MAVHSALQVFQPSTKSTSEGLYPYRLFVYVGAAIYPSLMAGLAFINSGPGYESLGAFCTLPIRPFWYRLALVWVPRYLVALVIIGLAIAIYSYVDLEFRNIDQSILASQTTQLARGSHDESYTETAITMSNTMHQSPCQGRNSGVVRSISSKRPATNTCIGSRSEPVSFVPCTCTESSLDYIINASAKWPEVSDPVPFVELSCGKSGPSDYTIDLQVAPSSNAHAGVHKNFSNPDTRLTHERRDRAPNTTGSASRQNLRVRRQLRLLSIYPLVYTLMWLIPFAHHCTMYIERYAQHPLWFLRLGATICISSMGFIDCLIFFLRERPWQSIATGEGTFRGSRMVWKSHKSKKTGTGQSQDTWTGKLGWTLQLPPKTPRPSLLERFKESLTFRSRRHSNDYARVTAAHARVRLQLERTERLTTQRGKNALHHATLYDGYGGLNAQMRS
jgi:hypothetical protein